MPSVPDEPIHPGRADGRPQGRPDGAQTCVEKQLRAYRIVKRYRGDRQIRAFAPAEWAEGWRLQPGDSSWPGARDG